MQCCLRERTAFASSALKEPFRRDLCEILCQRACQLPRVGHRDEWACGGVGHRFFEGWHRDLVHLAVGRQAVWPEGRVSVPPAAKVSRIIKILHFILVTPWVTRRILMGFGLPLKNSATFSG